MGYCLMHPITFYCLIQIDILKQFFTVNKGFVQSSVLVKVAVSPLDSKPTYDFSNSASVQSSCPDESDHTSTLNPLYPDIPDAALLPAAPPPYSFEPPPYEVSTFGVH